MGASGPRGLPRRRVVLPRRRVVALSLVSLLLSPDRALASRLTSKRTWASPDGNADLKWWTRYFGVEDTAEPRDAGGLGDYVCLTRYTAYALPDYFGIHFPESSVTAQGDLNVSFWRDAKRESAGGDMSTYSSFFTGATALWVPTLDAHLAAFGRDGIAYFGRSFLSPLDRKTIYVVTVASPGAYAVFEVLSDSCDTCEDHGDWPAYGAEEQAELHTLTASVKAITTRYDEATHGAYSTSAAGLPAAMVLQLRVAVSDLEGAYAYATRIWPTMALTNATQSFSAAVETGAYDLGSSSSGDSVQLVFAERANATARTFDAYEAYVLAQHEASLKKGDGNIAGGGMDRFVDDHIRFEDDAVSLDELARAHVSHGLRYHAYNWTRSCPGADLSFPGGFMIYSQGVGAQAIELGTNLVDFTSYGEDDLWSLDPCAASYECRALDDDDDDFDMAPFAVFLSEQLNLTQTSALALTIYFVSSAAAVGVVIAISSRVKRNHRFREKAWAPTREYHRIKEVVEI